MFEMLLESGRRSSLLPSWGRGAALTLHAVVLGALWRAPATPEPSVPSVISTEFPYQPPDVPVTSNQAPPVPDWIVDYRSIESLSPNIPIVPDTVLVTRLVGALSAPQPGAATPGPTTDVYPEPLVQEAPELLTAPTPAYPPLLHAAGVQGQVIVAAVVDTLGQPEAGSVRIVLSDNPGFNAAALATVGGARFRPARMYGRAVRVLVRIPVVFRLS